MEIILATLLAIVIILAILFLIFYFILFPRAAFHFIDEVKLPTKKDRVLVFAPHPDDEALGCFGYMHRSINSGAKVKVVVVTDGYITARPKRRYEETITALSKIGITKRDIIFLGFKDRKLAVSEHASRLFSEIIRGFKPTIILATSKYDANLDHRAAYRALSHALNTIKHKPTVLYYLIHYRDFPVPKGYYSKSYISPPITLVSPHGKWFKLTLGKEEEMTKREAILSYKSQLKMTIFLTRETALSFIRRNELFLKEH